MAKLRGFTLIELMVAVAIVAILSSVGFVTFSNSQKVGRDGKRKADLLSIATALELYNQQYKRYPCTNASETQNSTTTAGGLWIVNRFAVSNCGVAGDLFNNNFINAMPNDPSRNTAAIATGGYFYSSSVAPGTCAATTGRYYVLYTLLENSADKDTLTNKQYRDCAGTVFPAATYNANSYIVTPY